MPETGFSVLEIGTFCAMAVVLDLGEVYSESNIQTMKDNRSQEHRFLSQGTADF